MKPYDVIDSDGGVPIKAWIRGVPLEEAAAAQLRNVARLPVVHGWIAAMPDVHWGMAAVQPTLTANDLPDSLREVRGAIERAVPHGRTPGRDKGSWHHPPAPAVHAWATLKPRFDAIAARHEAIAKSNHLTHLGTL